MKSAQISENPLKASFWNDTNISTAPQDNGKVVTHSCTDALPCWPFIFELVIFGNGLSEQVTGRHFTLTRVSKKVKDS
jgi:hypothetical protein